VAEALSQRVLQAQRDSEGLPAESILAGTMRTEKGRPATSKHLHSTKVCAGPLDHVLPAFFRNAEQVSLLSRA